METSSTGNIVGKVKAVFGGTVAALGVLTGTISFDDQVRVLDGKANYVRAVLDDFTAENTQPGKKRTRDNDGDGAGAGSGGGDLCVAQGEVLLDGAEQLLREIVAWQPPKRRRVREGTGVSFSIYFKMHKLINELAGFEARADILSRNRTPAVKTGLPSRGDHLPVKKLIGQGAMDALEQLRAFLGDNEVRNIAICGEEGTGKTILMKHFYNEVLKWFDRVDYAFWITSPEQFSVRNLQEAVAAALKCDISDISDLTLRVETLLTAFGKLGRCVVFLDAVPNELFSLKQVGIPDPSKGDGCKLVLTTRFNSASEMLGSRLVRLDCLPKEEALELFLHEARLAVGSAPILEDLAKSLAKECHSLPSKIVDVATHLCGIRDTSEWSNALVELELLGSKGPVML